MATRPHISLAVKRPFDWQSLLAFLKLRATPGVESVSDSAYGRTIGGGEQLSVKYEGKTESLYVEYSGELSEGRAREIESRVRRIFKPDAATRSIEEFLGRSPVLAELVAQQPGLRVPGGWSMFEVAVRAVLGQQISVPAATTLIGRLVRLAGTAIDDAAWLFPTAEQVLQCDL